MCVCIIKIIIIKITINDNNKWHPLEWNGFDEFSFRILSLFVCFSPSFCLSVCMCVCECITADKHKQQLVYLHLTFSTILFFFYTRLWYGVWLMCIFFIDLEVCSTKVRSIFWTKQSKAKKGRKNRDRFIYTVHLKNVNVKCVQTK